MALYGYERDTMPAVEAFAKTAVVFDNAVVPRSLTRPSYASMLTGLYPFHHGVRSNAAVLHEDLTTLPEVLKSAGYHTAGFVSNFILVGELSGFDRDFDVYDDRVEETTFKRFHYERTAGNTVKAILEWLDSKPSQPFFLFVNLMDPHGPYTPPERLGRLYHSGKSRILNRYQIPTYQFIEGQLNYFDYVDRYDGEIRFADEAMGTLIEELKRRDLWDTSLVVFTADHGELLGEHNNIFFEHYFHVWEETMHVPLVIRLPRSSQRQTGSPDRPAVAGPKRIRSLCSPMDLMPTILAHLNLSCDVRFDGRNLLPVIGGGEDTDRALLLEFPNMPTPYVALPITFPDVYAIPLSR
jgi:arylsulfatase A-like enzyme